MFVVLEWNQASGRPELAVVELFDSRDDAQATAAALKTENRANNRREQYTVHEINMEEAEA